MPGGPSAAEESYARETHVSPTSEQQTHEHSAGADRNQLASVNHGTPTRTAMSFL